jgi:pimeloyl-ACP methyl ester carboxylesterase
MPGTAVSADGSRIGYESHGTGPPMLLVHGTSATHIRWAPVRDELARHYTVHEMDRRGRGMSADEAGGYGLQREAEDVAAVADATGGDVYVVAHSFGALCTIEAALVTDAFRRIVLYEPPRPTPGHNDVSPDVVAQLRAMNDREQILEAFYRNALRLPQPAIDSMRGSEVWNARLTAAHTIARELDAINAYQAGNRLGSIEVPVRMLLGAETTTFLRTATRAFAAEIPGVHLVELPGQAHQAIDLAPDQIIRLVLEFDHRA